ASGIKVLRTRDLIVRGNKVLRNRGKGIWSDTNYPTVLIEGNEVSDNSSSGIWHEAGYDAIIRLNIVERNRRTEPGSLLTRAGFSSPAATFHNSAQRAHRLLHKRCVFRAGALPCQGAQSARRGRSSSRAVSGRLAGVHIRRGHATAACRARPG